MFLLKREATFFRVDTTQDSARAATDYVPVSDHRLTFVPSGSVVQDVCINITDDNLIEESENFTASLTSLSPLVTRGSVATTTITILDDDGM